VAGASRSWRTRDGRARPLVCSPRPERAPPCPVPRRLTGWARAALARDERDALRVGGAAWSPSASSTASPRPQRIIGRRSPGRPELGVPSVVLTFDPIPARSSGRQPPPMLTSPTYKADLLEELGVTWSACCRSPGVQPARPRRFVHAVLVEHLHAKGGDRRREPSATGPGRRRRRLAGGGRAAGSASASRACPLQGSEDDTTWSSTYVRSCVQAGDVEGAAAGARAASTASRASSCAATSAARDRLPDREPRSRCRGAPCPADGVYAGRLVRGRSSSRPPSASAPTRPSPAASAGSRRTSSTSPATCTASGRPGVHRPAARHAALRRRRAARRADGPGRGARPRAHPPLSGRPDSPLLGSSDRLRPAVCRPCTGEADLGAHVIIRETACRSTPPPSRPS
jgi:riboflavin kinase/FMN adenylyltransferase